MICEVQMFPLLGLSLMVLENKAWINDKLVDHRQEI